MSFAAMITGGFGRTPTKRGRAFRSLGMVAVICALVSLPILALIFISASGTFAGLAHLVATVLPGSLATTVALLVGVAVLTALIGTITAWLVSFFEFTGRRIFSICLILPLSVPTYIASYGFVEFFSFTGPAQSGLRLLGDYSSARDYWFPDIRSLPGGILVLSLVLFPYVYISVRALFHFQSARLIESARVLGASQFAILRNVLVPLARPAIVIGVTLAMMEAINDIGAIEYMGIETLTFSIFSIWLNQNDVAGAAQIALVLLVIALLLISLERWGRQRRSFTEKQVSNKQFVRSRIKLTGIKSVFAFLACAFPILTGFGIPLWVLSGFAMKQTSFGINDQLINALTTSLIFAGFAALCTVGIALFLTYMVRISTSPTIPMLVRVASIGYAIPGTVIALGIFLPIATFDNFMDGMARQWLGFGTGLLITGSGVTILYAYAVRFMAMAEGTLDAGFKKLPYEMDAAARSLGRSSSQTFREILFPLMRPAVATAAMLVFIDSIKELSATIMLRPFGINTLSTYVYDYASLSRVDEVGVACLIIVLAGIIPSIYIARSSLLDR